MSRLYSSSSSRVPASADLPSWMYSPRDASAPPVAGPVSATSSTSQDPDQDVLFEQQQQQPHHHSSSSSNSSSTAPSSSVNNDMVRTERDPLLGASGLSPSRGNSSLLRRDFFTFRATRTATDWCFLLLFALYWIGMLVVGVYALTRDNNEQFAKYITDGIDFEGHPCPAFVYFPDFQRNPDFGFCIDTCPATDGQVLTTKLPVEVPTAAAASATSTAATPSGGANNNNRSNELRPVQFLSYASHPWTYVCKPANVDSKATMVAQLQDTIGRFVGALNGSWRVLLVGSGLSLGLSFVYLILLRYCGCIVLSGSIMGIESILVYGSYRLLGASMDPLAYVDDAAMKTTLQIAAVIMSCATVLFLAMALLSLRRLILAGTFINHATQVLSQLKQLLFVPFFIFVLLFALFGWGVFITICIVGAGHTSTRIARVSAYSPSSVDVRVETFTIDWRLRWFFLYHLWGMYWSVSMVLSIGEMITANAVSSWYFAKEDRITNLKHLTHLHPVRHAVKTTLRYHLGTLAFSSATVAIVCYMRDFFLYVEEQEELESSGVTQFLATCRCCCIWCFNYCLKYICKESVYITAIQGTSFNPSAKLAYTLISSNLLRVGALNRIGHAAVFLGKLIVCTTTCFVCWFLLAEVSSPILPLLAIMLFSYSVAHAFMTIYETTINMLLMCFTLDENMHGGRGNAMFASSALIRSVNDHLRPKWQTVL